MDNTKMSNKKQLPVEIKYKIDTEYYFYQIKQKVNLNLPWELCGYSDTDYKRDNANRKIVTGYAIIINKVVIK